MRMHTVSSEVLVLVRDVIVWMPWDCPWTSGPLPPHISLSNFRSDRRYSRCNSGIQSHLIGLKCGLGSSEVCGQAEY